MKTKKVIKPKLQNPENKYLIMAQGGHYVTIHPDWGNTGKQTIPNDIVPAGVEVSSLYDTCVGYTSRKSALRFDKKRDTKAIVQYLHEVVGHPFLKVVKTD